MCFGNLWLDRGVLKETLIGQALIDRVRELEAQGCFVHRLKVLAVNSHYEIQYYPPEVAATLRGTQDSGPRLSEPSSCSDGRSQCTRSIRQAEMDF